MNKKIQNEGKLETELKLPVSENHDLPPLQREGDRASGGRIELPKQSEYHSDNLRESNEIQCNVRHSEGVSPKESSLLNNPKAGLLRCAAPRNDVQPSTLTFPLAKQFTGLFCSAESIGEGEFNYASLEKRQGKWDHLKHLKFLLTSLPTYLLTKKKAAFTLAEVLITLGIIGVVAAMTLLAVVGKYQEKVLATQIKRAYSDVENALKLYAAVNACSDTTCISDLSTTNEDFTKRLYSVFKGAKYCSTSDRSHPLCQNSSVKANSILNNGSGITAYGDNFRRPFFVSSSGAAFQVVQYSECPRTTETNVKDSNGNYIIGEDGSPETQFVTVYTCALIYFDANGTHKGPNQKGADVYTLSLNANSSKWAPDSYLQKFLSTGKFNYTPYEVGVPINP